MYKHLKRLSKFNEEEYKKIKFEVEETVSQKDEKGIAQKELEVYKKAMERARLQDMMKRKNKEQGMVKRIVKTIKKI